MTDGRRIEMPCGHVARAVVGQFYLCETAPTCDQRPGGCHRCGSMRLYAFKAPNVPDGAWACTDCGAVRWTP